MIVSLVSVFIGTLATSTKEMPLVVGIIGGILFLAFMALCV
jgi:hypothetical protein